MPLRQVPPFPGSSILPPPPPHPTRPHARKLIPDTLSAPFRGTHTPYPLPAARATGGSLGLQRQRALRAGGGERRELGAQRDAKSSASVDLLGGAPVSWATVGLEQQKVWKVAGSHGEVSRAHGGLGTQAGTCRSRSASGSLRYATPPARAAGIRPRRAAPRPPQRRRGEPCGPPGSVRLSRPAEAPRWGAAGGAGRGGARPAARPPPLWLQPLPPPSFELAA